MPALIGITRLSVYLPRYRLPRATIAAAWGTTSLPGSKIVCNFDEDTLTMAQSAAWPLISGGAMPYRLISWRSRPRRIGSAPPPARSRRRRSSGEYDDHGFRWNRCVPALRALLAAFDAVAAGASRAALEVASDKRDGAPESAEEMAFSDAAAAVTIGADECDRRDCGGVLAIRRFSG